MHHPGPGGRAVDVSILRELQRAELSTTSELAARLLSPAGSIASKLRSLVRAELVEVRWGATRGATRAYALTDAGRRYLRGVRDSHADPDARQSGPSRARDDDKLSRHAEAITR
jgi:DNA-binding MarR family transcriptional regulator